MNHQTSYRSVSKVRHPLLCLFHTAQVRLVQDQWDNLYDFSLAVSADLANYDEDDGWPCLLDEYAQWRRNPTADGC
jgi:hypothetical protein